MSDKTAIADRFWSRVDKSGECWTWTASHFNNGYGQLQVNGRPVGAHRVAWSLASGQTLGESPVVCHTCDIKDCVRNDEAGVYEVDGVALPRFGHLFGGTTLANGLDMSQKGRSNKGQRRPGTGPAGERNSHAVIDASAVAEIRQASGTVRKIAQTFGISKSQVSNIRRRAQWKETQHV